MVPNPFCCLILAKVTKYLTLKDTGKSTTLKLSKILISFAIIWGHLAKYFTI
jgi:hypothetical protein